MMTKFESGKKTVFGNDIDYSKISELMKAKKPLLDKQYEKVYVRCNRDTGTWDIVDEHGYRFTEKYAMEKGRYKADEHGNYIYKGAFKRGIMRNVVFTTYENGIGCGVTQNVGLAYGELLPEDAAVSVPTEDVTKIGFDDEQACFYRRKQVAATGKTKRGEDITTADFLILKDKCSAEVVSNGK